MLKKGINAFNRLVVYFNDVNCLMIKDNGVEKPESLELLQLVDNDS